MRNKSDFIPSCSRVKHRTAIFLSVLFILSGTLSCDREKGGEPKDHSNSLPVITSIQIFPENPNVTQDLNLTIRSQDPGGDPITYHYQWMKDEQEIPGENRSTLPKGNFRKGTLISVKIVPSDGKTQGKPFLSDPVKILNSPPI